MEDNNGCGIVIGVGCINHCPFCDFVDYRPDERRIRDQEIKILKDLTDFKRKGYKKIYISGSDPIEYKKITPLVRYIKSLGFEDIHLSTHGRLLSDAKFTKDIIEAGVNQFRLPIYGSTEKIHDSITRSKGSFKDLIKAIDNISRYKSVVIDLNTLIMQENKDDLLNILTRALSFNPREFGISVMYVKEKENYKHYVPIKELGIYIPPLFKKVVSENLNVKFFDMPYCIFGEYSNIIMMPKPPNLGKYNQPGGKFKSEIKDLPTYRLKTKVKLCEDCILSDKCDGFLINDIKKYGTGKIKPIGE
jgi:pyruvate-formate lyase-activating enzyme